MLALLSHHSQGVRLELGEQFVMSFLTPAPTNSFHTILMSLNCLFSQHFKVPFPFPLLFLQEHFAIQPRTELLQTKQLPVLHIQEENMNI